MKDQPEHTDPHELPHVPQTNEPENQPAESAPPGEGEISEPARVEDATPHRPVRKREILAVLLLVVLADLTIYRGPGFAGWAVFLALAPGLLALGARKLPRSLSAMLVVGMLFLLVLKSLWLGTGLLVGYGIALLVAFAMELTGRKPFVLDVLAYALQTIKAGFLRWDDYLETLKATKWGLPRAAVVKYGLPAVTVLGFATIFVMANPDVARLAGERLAWLRESLFEAVTTILPSWSQALFWIAIAGIAAGLLKPAISRSILGDEDETLVGRLDDQASLPASLYPAYVNTLIAVIGLFALYLVFEFQTLWFREFPEGFHYSGYAHEGAAWLTVALALATVVLSVIFRADVLRDPRLPKLKTWAWIWSVENLLLAAAVYHRLLIYVGFNGMTRMRAIGFLGISAVVAGFVLVVWKITAGRNFVWLIRRQLWVLAVAGFFYAAMPVDSWVHRYNVRRILAGDPAPAVQISVHPIDAGGVLELFPLLEAEDDIIREGVRAMLAEKADTMQGGRSFHLWRAGKAPASKQNRSKQSWLDFQWAEHNLAEHLKASESVWNVYRDYRERERYLKAFHDYAYQWY